jgi:hypothetical protein
MAVTQSLLRSPKLKPTTHSHPLRDPPALRWYIPVFATIICRTFIAVLQYYLCKSHKEGGVIFAENVNDLPLCRSFIYLYMPTIFTTVFSIFIVWIDLDSKRYEPYYQLFKPGGALGKDSLLLHYPFDFLPAIPFVASRNRLVQGCIIVFVISRD